MLAMLMKLRETYDVYHSSRHEAEQTRCWNSIRVCLSHAALLYWSVLQYPFGAAINTHSYHRACSMHTFERSESVQTRNIRMFQAALDLTAYRCRTVFWHAVMFQAALPCLHCFAYLTAMPETCRIHNTHTYNQNHNIFDSTIRHMQSCVQDLTNSHLAIFNCCDTFG